MSCNTFTGGASPAVGVGSPWCPPLSADRPDESGNVACEISRFAVIYNTPRVPSLVSGTPHSPGLGVRAHGNLSHPPKSSPPQGRNAGSCRRRHRPARRRSGSRRPGPSFQPGGHSRWLRRRWTECLAPVRGGNSDLRGREPGDPRPDWRRPPRHLPARSADLPWRTERCAGAGFSGDRAGPRHD